METLRDEEPWPDSPPDFGEEAGFKASVEPYIRPPETYYSLFDWQAHGPGGLSWRLAMWWRRIHPEPGTYAVPTISGYSGLAPCLIVIEVREEGGGHCIYYCEAEPFPGLSDEEDDSGDQ